MSSKEIFIASIILAVGLILFSLVNDKKSFVVKTFFRGVMGIFVIYFTNAFLLNVQIPINLGVNICTICTSSLLGLPGIAVLYGILGCEIL